MTSRRALVKLASILFRHVEHYTVTAKATVDSVVQVCTDMPEYFESVPGVEFQTPEQIMQSVLLETPWQMRIDAVTTPSYPAGDLDTLITAILPGCGGRLDPLDRETPAEIISEYSNMWHEMANRFDIKEADPSIVELRYDIGQPKYSHTAKNDGYTIPGLLSEFSSYMPRDTAGEANSSALCRGDRFYDYYDDHVWMRRAVYEMLPVAAYQMLCYGCQQTSRNPSGHIEEYCYMPMMPGIAAAEHIMRGQLDALVRTIPRTGRPLGYVVAPDSARVITSMNWSGCLASEDTTSLSAGIYGLDLHTVGLASGFRPISDLNQMERVKLNQSPTLVRRNLYRLHEGDPLWPFLEVAFSDEVS